MSVFPENVSKHDGGYRPPPPALRPVRPMRELLFWSQLTTTSIDTENSLEK